ncbi:SpoIVB peptidase [Ruminococcus sp. OA3]|uniref:SpoIVB peptidase n=1 Tax=Ruminococcus sp. OA3 TaxID=2914164 RepID=UPI001F05A97C|nr:SpoIVB peptidase [Ruminococcus sp. OA3]
MSNSQKYRRFLWVMLCLSLMLCAGYFYYTVQSSIPDEISVYEGQEEQLDEIFPSTFVTYDDSLEVVGSDSYRITCRLFGVVPVKTVTVQNVAQRTVCVSGDTIGLYMETDGVMIIDTGEVDAQDAMLNDPAKNIAKAGDYIMEVNGKKLEDKQELMQMVEDSQGDEMQLLVKRGEEEIMLALQPVLTTDGSYKLGIWVRDNIQGIGTLTYMEEDGTYGALGHGISDMDTGELLSLEQGELYSAKILSISKGVKGNPGELKGVITYQETEKLGDITDNQANGISGTLNDNGRQRLSLTPKEIGLKQEIQEGPASILSNVDGTVEEYGIEISDIDYNEKNTNKSFVIHVTDQRLLGATGGIVQGMSGSPILQNGKLIGAVTHVFIKDPSRGFGIFIENMLKD